MALAPRWLLVQPYSQDGGIAKYKKIEIAYRYILENLLTELYYLF